MELLILLFVVLALVILKLTIGREAETRTKTVSWPLLPERTSILHIPEKEIRDLKLFFDGRILTASYSYVPNPKEKAVSVLIETE